MSKSRPDEAYCVRCRKVRQMVNIERHAGSIGPYIVGVCNVCGVKLARTGDGT